MTDNIIMQYYIETFWGWEMVIAMHAEILHENITCEINVIFSGVYTCNFACKKKQIGLLCIIIYYNREFFIERQSYGRNNSLRTVMVFQ